MDSMDMELREAIGSIAFALGAASSASMETKSSRARASFQWGGSIFGLILLILNGLGRSSRTQSNLLVLYLFTSFPGVLFKIVRGEFGYWVAFLAIAANLFFPETFPASRFLVFVVTPNWIADGLRDSMFGGVFCLIIAILLVITEVRELGGLGHCRCNFHCFAYGFSIAFIFFFTILYLCLGTW
ncbi:hypothetical protein L6164_019991 [Bauhinia variegata]|uniref:Uncharacterized protein n=1 Tax=Bauhinia variegata TaxID=167791 RepID=A0ACB9MV80_BAUVA|nr:hypothetical protein L6164_019991 [Bauhinia variegata]